MSNLRRNSHEEYIRNRFSITKYSYIDNEYKSKVKRHLQESKRKRPGLREKIYVYSSSLNLNFYRNLAL